ncbi:YbaB/EbfC family nucleoid-associated protein [Amycolatopsis aidingensis]|uniref:YbaB/EbfC family nucleoid-associated protein n=1 Tax=Amycolatopsis aidingensis TaxID=2842453 RepID=UPI001C0CAD7E|nr:YbaB/EbfC family nucleoid-associated protein [Amycolatopsis aidingensis]
MTEQPEPDWLADLRRRGAEMVRQSEQAQEQLGELSETASSADGAVRVTVGASGALRGLVVEDTAMRSSGAELSATILRLAGTAQAAVARRAVEIVEPFAGETGAEFLRSQLPAEEAEERDGSGGSGRRTGSGQDDEEPPQSFLQRGY